MLKTCLFRTLATVTIVAAMVSPAAAVTVVNGGFETGDFTGWTQFGDPSFASVSSDPPVPQSGVFGASFGTVKTNAGITQSVVTVPGALYKVDFWLQNEADPFGVVAPNSFAFTWGGVSELSLVNAPAFNYTHFVFNLAALSSSTELGFTFRQDPAFYDLDNVAVAAAVPEPETWALFSIGLAAVAALKRRRASGTRSARAG